MRNEANPPRPVEIAKGNGETILVIDDESGVREMVRRLLEFRGFRTLVAGNGPEGLAIYRDQQTTVRAVLTDMRMAEMNGTEVIRELRLINPNARIVAMSGMIDVRQQVREEPGRLAFLTKPMTSAELMNAVQSVLGDPPETAEKTG